MSSKQVGQINYFKPGFMINNFFIAMQILYYLSICRLSNINPSSHLRLFQEYHLLILDL
jgi:hypothetical protein